MILRPKRSSRRLSERSPKEFDSADQGAGTLQLGSTRLWRDMVFSSSLDEDLLGTSKGKATGFLADFVTYERKPVGELSHKSSAIPWH